MFAGKQDDTFALLILLTLVLVPFPVSNLSGVPQGSHLGPTLFDLCRWPQNIHASDRCHNDCLLFQDYLDHLHSWCEVNHLHLHFSKWKICDYKVLARVYNIVEVDANFMGLHSHYCLRIFILSSCPIACKVRCYSMASIILE